MSAFSSSLVGVSDVKWCLPADIVMHASNAKKKNLQMFKWFINFRPPIFQNINIAGIDKCADCKMIGH